MIEGSRLHSASVQLERAMTVRGRAAEQWVG